MSYNESLRLDSNYPPMSQSDWDRAPWNEDEGMEEIEVTVLVSLEKTLKLQVPKGYEHDDIEEAYQDAESAFIDKVFQNNYELENIEIIEWEELVDIAVIALKEMVDGIVMIMISR